MRAVDDLNVAEHALKSEAPFVRATLFHCQQAVEKALKGFLTWHDCQFEKTHDLRKVGMLCSDVDRSLEPLLKSAAALTQYASKFRYPGVLREPSLEEALESLALARQVMAAIFERLPAEVRP